MQIRKSANVTPSGILKQQKNMQNLPQKHYSQNHSNNDKSKSKQKYQKLTQNSNLNQNSHQNEVDINIDAIIKQLLSLRSSKPGKLLNLKQQQVAGIIRLAKQKFMNQPMMLQIGQSKIKICGDLHGQYYDMLRIFQYGGYPPQTSYLFMGDYVDRGRQGIETICLLFALKIKYPNKIFILRGNHQSASINRIYGFYQQCKKRYNLKIWKSFIDCFNWLPIAALIQGKILCMHGGLSPDLITLNQINSIVRPTDIPDSGIICDLLWSDPDSTIKLWGQSQRGISYHFGNQVVSNFLKKNNLDLICRAHQVVQQGYQFFAKKKLVTIFSAPNYCGQFNNCGAIMNVQEDLTCSFQILKPLERNGPFKQTRPNTPPKKN